MSAGKLDRLAAADNLFLAAEENLPNFYGSPGFAFIFAGAPPSIAELRETVELSLARIPRLRQVVRYPPLRLGRPIWVDDPTFNLDDHLHEVCLTDRDGDDAALQRLIEQIYSARLERNRAMWQLWLVSGMTDGRFALLFRTHHALGDGVAFAQYFTRVLFTAQRDRDDALDAETPWQPAEAPRTIGLIGAWLRERLELARRLPARRRRLAGAMTLHQRVRSTLVGAVALARMIAAPIPELPELNPPLSPYRRIRWSRFPLEQLSAVKRVYQCKINDVFLAIVAGALREWLLAREVDMSEIDVEVGFPVSTAAAGSLAELGNRMIGLRVALPTSLPGAEARLRATRERVDAAKASAQPLATGLVISLEEHLPAALLRTSAHLHTTPGLFNMFASNIAGPEEPLSLLGRELLDIFPINLLMGRYAFVQTMISYRGRVCFSVVGNGSDARAVDEMIGALERAREELVELAAGVQDEGLVAGAR